MATDRVVCGSSSEIGREQEQQQEHDTEAKLLRGRFRLSAISIAESEGKISNSVSTHYAISSIESPLLCFNEFSEKFEFLIIHKRCFVASKSGMEISKLVVSCIADLAFKFTEGLAKDLQLFAQHANRKCVKMEDVILSAHRNVHMSSYLRTFSNDLKAKDPPSERKWKKEEKKNDKITISAHV
ncbi:hypothetical protein PIB30_020660 [Stylosanthes scabra]|uniref:Centromere protein S n=1 Tax=Stylosanthes scabra TaxID=79078 RepID=A0ABU6V7L7_9FABA|nr:hypothetical protein [Stylosanthes scabra]